MSFCLCLSVFYSTHAQISIFLSSRRLHAFTITASLCPSPGPDKWADNFPVANGPRQSPIDIVPGEASFDEGLPPLQLTYDPSTCLDILNNGHSFQVTFLDDADSSSQCPSAVVTFDFSDDFQAILCRGAETKNPVEALRAALTSKMPHSGRIPRGRHHPPTRTS